VVGRAVGPPSPKGFGAAAFASSLRSKRRLVEAAGVEPASSESIPLKLLHAYPAFWVFAFGDSHRRDSRQASLLNSRPQNCRRHAESHLAESTLRPGPARRSQRNGSRLSGYGVRVIVCVCFFPNGFTRSQDLGMQLKLHYLRRTRFAPFIEICLMFSNCNVFRPLVNGRGELSTTGVGHSQSYCFPAPAPPPGPLPWQNSSMVSTLSASLSLAL